MRRPGRRAKGRYRGLPNARRDLEPYRQSVRAVARVSTSKSAAMASSGGETSPPPSGAQAAPKPLVKNSYGRAVPELEQPGMSSPAPISGRGRQIPRITRPAIEDADLHVDVRVILSDTNSHVEPRADDPHGATIWVQPPERSRSAITA